MKPNLLNKIFQSRVTIPVKFAPPMQGTLGTVSFDEKSNTALAGFVPVQSALGRTVRLHEADHLRSHTPPDHKRRFITEARKAGITDSNLFTVLNGLEDIYISTLPVWDKRPTQVRRDAKATALRELRNALASERKYPTIGNADAPLDIQDSRRCSLLNLLFRDYAILSSNMGGGLGNDIGARKLAKDLCVLTGTVPSTLSKLLNTVRDGNLATARHIAINLAKPLERPPLALPETDLSSELPDYDENEHADGLGIGSAQSAQDVPVKLICPPLTAPCIAGLDQGPHEDHASVGYSIRRSALVSLGIGIPISRPFLRRESPAPGGVIIIDASGSMHIDSHKLRALCKSAPAATVAYYSGGENGYIVIYAKDGSRLDDSIPLPNHCEGNVADEKALLYGLSERKRQGCTNPVILISDLGFNGNSEESESRAKRILADGLANGSIRVIEDFTSALAEFTHAAVAQSAQ